MPITTDQTINTQQQTHPTQISNANLADQLGQLRDMRKSLEQRENDLKQELKRRGRGQYTGDIYIVNLNPRQRSNLRKQDVVAALGQDWVDQHSNVTNYTEISTQMREEG